jgi:hypothetical protein
MNEKAKRLLQRRERLVAQAEAQRQNLARDIEPLRAPLALADRGLRALRYVNRHPKWMVGGVVLLAVLQPRHAFRWLGRGWLAWQAMSGLRDRLDTSPPDHPLPEKASRLSATTHRRAGR